MAAPRRLLEAGVDDRILEIKGTLTRERRTSWAHLKTPEGGLLPIRGSRARRGRGRPVAGELRDLHDIPRDG